MVFVREDQTFPDIRVRHVLKAASWSCPNWSAELAETLIGDFGLAARAEVTLFDEPYAGLDAVARQLFYDRLLAEYAEHPRAMVLSTHLIDEVAGLLERVVVIDRGRVVLDADTDDLRGAFVTVSGPVAAVESLSPAALSGIAAGSAPRRPSSSPGPSRRVTCAAPATCTCAWSPCRCSR